MALHALHLVVYATPHGYGHAAIASALLNSLAGLYPQARVSIVSTVPRTFFAERLMQKEFAYYPRLCGADFGMAMASASHVLIEESAQAYLTAHAGWSRLVADEETFLTSLRPDLVLSCAAYLPLAAAERLGIPAISFGPFTWLGIAASFFGDHRHKDRILAPMREAYGQATAILATTPALAWEDDITDLRTVVGPIGSPCQDSPALLQSLRASFCQPDEKMALISLGGIPESLAALEQWPQHDGWRWLAVAPAGQSFNNPAITCLARTPLSVSQAIACADAIVTKPGYGTYVEAACSGTPLLYRSRPGWPETPGLAHWLASYTGVREISDTAFATGDIVDALESIIHLCRRPLVYPPGNEQAATCIQEILG